MRERRQDLDLDRFALAKTVEALAGHLGTPAKIRPTLKEFDALLSSRLAKTAARH